MDVEGLAQRLGGEIESGAHGAVLVVERQMLLPGVGREPHGGAARTAVRLTDQRGIFLDIETTGLRAGAGTLVVLVGLAWAEGQQATVRQYVLHDPAAEPALLRAVDGRLRAAPALVTFNGKRFDQPMLLNRFLLHRLGDPFPPDHLDLLHSARRIWSRRLRQTSLGALEAGILGMSRVGDVPGSEVPARFFEFVRAGNTDGFAPVLDHNRQDLISLIRLTALVGQLLEGEPGPGAAPSDLLGLGGLCDTTGRPDRARRCYEAALVGARPSERAEAGFRLAGLLQRAGELERAFDLYQVGAAGSGRWAFSAAIEGAKLAEHTRREPMAALALAHRALRILTAGSDPSISKHLPAVLRRVSRLERKVGAES